MNDERNRPNNTNPKSGRAVELIGKVGVVLVAGFGFLIGTKSERTRILTISAIAGFAIGLLLIMNGKTAFAGLVLAVVLVEIAVIFAIKTDRT